MPSVKFVYIPAHPSDPLEQWSVEYSGEEDEVECLLNRVKVAAQRAALLAHVPEASRANLPESVLAAAAEGGLGAMVENVALLSNAPAHNFVGVNMYCDDEAAILGAPPNPRACEIAALCGKPLQVRGDAFLARVRDSEAEFERQDFLLGEVSSGAPWVRAAAEQAAARAARGESAEAIMARLGAAGGVRGPGGGSGESGRSGAKQALPPPPPPTPSAAARTEGNVRFAAGDWAAAIECYTRSADLAAGEGGEAAVSSARAAALNNRAAARLKAGDAAGAAEDAAWVLSVQPRNVKAALRRGAAREALGEVAGAVADYRAALAAEPGNRQAADALRRLQAEEEAG